MNYRTRIVALAVALLGLAAIGLLLFTELSLRRELDGYLAPEQVHASIRRARLAAILIVGVIFLPACLLAWMFGRALAHPLESTALAVRRISEGKPPQFPHFSIPEAEHLVNAVRTMNERAGATRAP